MQHPTIFYILCILVILLLLIAAYLENRDRKEFPNDGWIQTIDELPDNNTQVIGYDIESLTPEKHLLFKDGHFFYCSCGIELDYTPFIIKWRTK